MAEDNHPDHDPPQTTPSATPSATPSSNQNLILGIVMGAVVLLLLLLVINQQFDQEADSPQGTESDEITRELADERTRVAQLRSMNATSGQSAKALIDEITRDAEALRNLVDDSQLSLVRAQNAERNLDIANRRNGELRSQLTQYQGAAARVPDLEARIKSLQDRINGSVDETTADSLRNEINRLKAERNQLANDLADLRTKMAGMIDRAQYEALQTELESLRGLRREVQRLRAELDRSKLFVTKDQLSPRAAKLFRELERLEGTDRAGLEQAYLRIEQDFNAKPVEAATFETGSANLARKHENHLRTVVGGAPTDSFFLVVGYASQSGDSQENEKLSSRRATRVASVVNFLKKSGQDVQAVYLGETTRFGQAMAPNQVSEVWEIRP